MMRGKRLDARLTLTLERAKKRTKVGTGSATVVATGVHGAQDHL
jgi:hypothetical protein